MKTSIYARMGAEPINFPDIIQIHYQCLDEQDRRAGEDYKGLRFTWDQVQQQFFIDIEYARACEGYFRDGQTAFLGIKTVTGKFYEKGEILPDCLTF